MVFGTNALQLIEIVKRRKKSKIDLQPVLVAGEPQPVGLHGAAAEPSHHIHCPFSSGFYFIKYFAFFFKDVSSKKTFPDIVISAVPLDWRLRDDRQQPQPPEHVLDHHRGHGWHVSKTIWSIDVNDVREKTCSL